MLAYPGIWTPAAQVLCLTCHGPTLKFGRDTPTRGWEDRETAREVDTSFRCDDCGRQTAILSDVDFLAYLRDRLRDAGLPAEMEQTGGMCAAVRCGDWMIFNDDDEAGMFGAAKCDEEGNLGEDSENSPTLHAEDMVAFLKSRRE